MAVIDPKTYFDKRNALEGRINTLETEIGQEETELAKLEKEYADLVLEGKDDQADEVYQQKRAILDKLPAKKERLDTLHAIKYRDLLKYGLEVMESSKSIPGKFKGKIAAAEKEIEKAKEAYLNSLKGLRAINDEYRSALSPYKQIHSDLGIDEMDILEAKRKGISPFVLDDLHRTKRNQLISEEDYFIKSYQDDHWILVQDTARAFKYQA